MSEVFVNGFAAATTLNGAIDASQTTLSINPVAASPPTGTFRIRIGNEILIVTNVAGSLNDDYTVERGAEDTIAASHPHLSPVNYVLTAGALASIDYTAKEDVANKDQPNGYAGLDGSSKLTGSQQVYGTTSNTAAEGNDSRLSNARTPTAHAASHKLAGTDPIKLDELAAPTDVTTLNATTGAHGLLPKLGGGTTNFLRADGSWAAPAGTGLTGTGASGQVSLWSGSSALSGSAGLTFATGPNALSVIGAEGEDAVLNLWADEGDDNADKFSLVSKASDNTLLVKNHTTTLLTLTAAGGMVLEGVATFKSSSLFQGQAEFSQATPHSDLLWIRVGRETVNDEWGVEFPSLNFVRGGIRCLNETIGNNRGSLLFYVGVGTGNDQGLAGKFDSDLHLTLGGNLKVPTGSVIINDTGSNLAQNSTTGWLGIPGVATGEPSGTPTGQQAGCYPMFWDSVNKKLSVWDGSAWLQTAALT